MAPETEAEPVNLGAFLGTAIGLAPVKAVGKKQKPGTPLTDKEIEAIAITGPVMESIYAADPQAHMEKELGRDGWSVVGAAELGAGLRPSQFDNGRFEARKIDFSKDARDMVNSGRIRNHLDHDGQKLWDKTAGVYQKFRGSYNGTASKVNSASARVNGTFGTKIGTIPTAPRLGDIAIAEAKKHGTDMNAELGAIIMRKGDTAVLAFRGSRTGGDGWAATFDQDRFYESGRPLYDAFKDYVTNPENGIKNVRITGHSLGGAMTQMYSYRDMPALRQAGLDVQAVAYASPGVQATDAPSVARPPTDLLTVQGKRDHVSNKELALGAADILDLNKQVNGIRGEMFALQRKAVKATSGTWVSGLVKTGIIAVANEAHNELDDLAHLARNTEVTAMHGHRQWDNREIYYDYPNRPENKITGDWGHQHWWVLSREFSDVVSENAALGHSFQMGQVVNINRKDGDKPFIIGPDGLPLEAPNAVPQAPEPAHLDETNIGTPQDQASPAGNVEPPPKENRTRMPMRLGG